MLEFYTSSCPGEGDSGSSISVTAGEAGEELWCISTDSAHNVVATGIAADKMEVTLFADKGCSAPVTKFDTDGCKVIPEKVSIIRNEWKDCKAILLTRCRIGCDRSRTDLAEEVTL